MFVMSTFFEKTITAQTVASVSNVWGSILLLIVTVFMRHDLFDGGQAPPDNEYSALVLIGLMCVLPPYGFMWAIYQLVIFMENSELKREREFRNGDSTVSSFDIWRIFDLNQVGGTILCMAIWAGLSAMYLHAVESKMCSGRVELPFERRHSVNQADEEV